jgi:hypothetical protein
MGLHSVAITHYSLHSHIKPVTVQYVYIYIRFHTFVSGGVMVWHKWQKIIIILQCTARLHNLCTIICCYCSLLGCDILEYCRWIPTFCTNILLLSLKNSSLKMGISCSSKTSIPQQYYTVSQNKKFQPKQHCHKTGKLKYHNACFHKHENFKK